VFCAKMLKEMITRIPLFSKKCFVAGDANVINELDVKRPNSYITSGLQDLYKYLKELGTQAGARKKILIRTGGYKEVSADLKMMAMALGYHSYYLFEDSTQFVVVEGTGWPGSYDGVLDPMVTRIV